MLQEEAKRKARLRVLLKQLDVICTAGSYRRTTLVQHEIFTENIPPKRTRVRHNNHNPEEGLHQQTSAREGRGAGETENCTGGVS